MPTEEKASAPLILTTDDVVAPASTGNVDDLRGLAEEEQQRYARITELQIEDYRGHIETRSKFANRIFWFVSSWMASVFGILVADGTSVGGFDLADGVLIALISGTTLNVLGLFAIVANYFFPKSPPPGG